MTISWTQDLRTVLLCLIIPLAAMPSQASDCESLALSSDQALDITRIIPDFSRVPIPLMGYAGVGFMEPKMGMNAERATFDLTSYLSLILSQRVWHYAATRVEPSTFIFPMDLTVAVDTLARANGIKLGINFRLDNAPELGAGQALMPVGNIPFTPEGIAQLKLPTEGDVAQSRFNVILEALRTITKIESKWENPRAKIIMLPGPFTMATDIMGINEAMMAVVMEPETFQLLMHFSVSYIKSLVSLIHSVGGQKVIIKFLDPAANLMGPEGFKTHAIGPVNEVTAFANNLGFPVIIHPCVTQPWMIPLLRQMNVQGYHLYPGDSSNQGIGLAQLPGAYNLLTDNGARPIVILYTSITTPVLAGGTFSDVGQVVNNLRAQTRNMPRLTLTTPCDMPPMPWPNVEAYLGPWRR